MVPLFIWLDDVLDTEMVADPGCNLRAALNVWVGLGLFDNNHDNIPVPIFESRDGG